MPKYIFAYHQPKDYVPAADADSMAAWGTFFEEIGSGVVEMGAPIVDRTAIGEVGATTQLGGYSVVTAASLDEAATLAKGSPILQAGGGVQVGELGEM